MARLIEFSRRSTVQLQKILEFYDERNGNDAYSRRLLKCLLSDLQYSGAQKCLSPLRPFDCTSDNISVHLQNIYDTDELKKEATTEKISVVRREGNKDVNRTLQFYNLDAIISTRGRRSACPLCAHVGIADEEEDAEPFEEKMARLTSELGDLFAESHRLEAGIREKLAGIGFNVK